MKRHNISGLVRLVPVVLALILGLSSLAAAIVGDLNNDDSVDWLDVGILRAQWLANGGSADINLDNHVDSADFALLAKYWREAGPDPNLVGWYKLDEDFGDIAHDSSIHGYDGTLLNGVTWAPTSGKLKGAASFSASADDDQIEIYTTGMKASAGTIALWGYLWPTGQSDYRFLFGTRNYTGWGNRIQLYMDGVDTNLDLGLGNNHQKRTNIIELEKESWYHIALTWEAWDGVSSDANNYYAVYVNGVEKATGRYFELDTLSATANIGNNGDSKLADRHQAFHGLIDDSRIWNRMLYAYEIIDVYGSVPQPVLTASNPNPNNEATDVSVDTSLIWSPGDYAASHDVYLGTNESDVNDANNSWPVATWPGDPNVYKGNQQLSYYDPCGLEYNTIYFWRIDEVNDVNVWKGKVWSFTTEEIPPPPGQASGPYPTDLASDVSIFANLGWTMGDGADSRDVYFGPNESDVNDANDSWPVATGPGDPNVYKGNQLSTIFDPGTMDVNTTYYWRIDEKNRGGTTTGDVWEFTTEAVATAPEKATNVNPSHLAIIVDTGDNLMWTAGDGAESHDVYFGTDSTPDAGEFQGNQTGSIFDPGIMDVHTTYYWRIDEKNAAGTTTGDVWSFDTREFPIGTMWDLYYWNVIWGDWDPCDQTFYEWDLDGSKRARLDDFNDVHPRLLLTSADVNDLKSKINDSNYPTHQYIWNNVVKPKADTYLERIELGLDPPSGYNSEEPMRQAGRGVPWIALAYLLTEDPNYLEGAEYWMTTMCGYPEWHGNWSLGAGECLFGVSIGYDWLYDDLTEPNRVFIRNKLIDVASDMNDYWVQHGDRYLANHCHVERNGLGAAGFVLYGDPSVPEATGWIKRADLIFQAGLRAGGHDGSSTEGHAYWGYSMESLLCFTEAAQDLMDANYYDAKWLKNAANFIIFTTLPDFDMIQKYPGYANCVMSFGDSYRDYRSHGPTHTLCLLASKYNNGYAQWLADEMLERGIGITEEYDYRAWASLLWYDENVQPVPLANLPTFWHFDDMGLVTSRSGWDEDAVMVGYKCGPMHSHKLQPYYEWQIDEGWPSWPYYHSVVNGHCHPDISGFQIYAYGKWLATEPGKESPKYTKNHCTILVNGLGQLGGGDAWFDRAEVMDAKAKSAIIKAENTLDYDYIIGDAQNIYRDPNLTKFYRHFVYIKPDIILIADELEADTLSDFEWRLRTTHKRAQFIDDMNIVEQNPNEYYIIENNNDADVVVMDVHFIHPGLVSFSTSTEGEEFLKANFDSTGSDLLAAVLHPRRDEQDASEIVSSSFVDSVLYLTIGCGAEETNVELDLATQEVYIY